MSEQQSRERTGSAERAEAGSVPTAEFTMRITQQRSKLVVVRASGPFEAQQMALEQVQAECGGWDWANPMASFVSARFDDEHGSSATPDAGEVPRG